MKKLKFESLMIEVTRKCNFKCQHCIRGESENKEIPYKDLYELFSKTKSVDCLMISGGEPTLAPHKLKEINELIKLFNISIGAFYIATNGTESYDFIIEVIKLFGICDDKECCKLDISLDNYHQLESDSRNNIYKALSFYGERRDKYTPKNTINAGRAAENGIGEAELGFALDKDLIHISEDEIYIEYDAEVFLNAEGEILFGCNWSYEQQEGKVFATPYDITEELEKFMSE